MHHVESWFDGLPETWQDQAQRLRTLIMEAAPAMREGWRYGTPFYDHRRWLCYLSFQKGRLVLGFIQGALLVDPDGLLSVTDHKQIRHYHPPAHGPLPEAALRLLLAEAVRVNEVVDDEKMRGRRPNGSRRRF